SQHLSRGMLQKLALGVGLITDPKILLLDEPTLGMDVASSRKMRDMILALAKKEGKAILLTTHQLELVEELADRVGIIRNGQLVVEGTLAELKSIFQTYIYNVKLRGDWNPDEKIIKEYSITSKPRQGEYTEVSADCGSKDGIFRFLDRIRNDSLEVISFYKLEEDLEEIFLRVLKEN
ncbi:MAG TPA: ABC transporter ATP-binding protein, partial [Leptospiraceae bacterium]|nr:ABC transporter ATP-binding protein [Leptospiraceae bacterium]